MTKILVTGGLGFIGFNFVKYFDSKVSNYKIIILDKSKKKKKKLNYKFKNNIKFIYGHTKNISSLLKNEKGLKYCFHFGEFPRIVASFKYKKECLESNSIGTTRLIYFCLQNKIKFFYSGSSSIFGNNGKDRNLSLYSYLKYSNIELLKNFHKWFNLEYEINYFYNVYGPGHETKGKYAAVIGIFEESYLNNKPLPVVNNTKYQRDFTHVDDIVKGIYLSFKQGKNSEYLLGTNKNHRIIDVAKMFSNNIKFIPERPGEREKSTITNNNAEKILGYKADIKLIDYIKNFKEKNKKKA